MCNNIQEEEEILEKWKNFDEFMELKLLVFLLLPYFFNNILLSFLKLYIISLLNDYSKHFHILNNHKKCIYISF